MAQLPGDTALDSGWSVRIDPADAAAAKAHPGAAGWFPAHVPGSVQQDLIASGQVPDPFLGQNEGAIQWAGLTDWQYRTAIAATPEMLARGHVDLVLDGLDTFAQVTLNGVKLLATDNAHRQWRVPVKDVLHPGENTLEIHFASPIRTLQPMVLKEAHPLPGEYDSIYGDEPEGKQTSPYIRKPKYHYGWDWGPRIVNIGPWRKVHLQAWDSARIETMRVTQEALGDASARLTASFDIQADHDGPFALRATIAAPDGSPAVPFERHVDLVAGLNHVSLPLDIAHPQRWWPAGCGAQPLYTVAGTLSDTSGALGSVTHRIGLRKVDLLREKDDHGRGFAFRVNGVPIFAKGANVIPFDSFPARVTPAKIRSLLSAARDANMNMLRVWGGGIYPDDAFYDAADELGLMVWQDFMFGGAVTPPDPAYRENVRIEAEQQVARLQAHPSLVLWSGNNEVLSGWDSWDDRKSFKKAIGADEQEKVGVGMAILFDGVLRKAAEEGDPDAVYWPGSPSANYEDKADQDHNGDRHYWDVWGGKKPVESYLDACPRFMSEYGLEAMPDMKTIRAFAGKGPLAIGSPVLRAHQKFLKGEGNDRLLDYIGQRYGKPRDVAEMVYLSQVMQAEGIELAALHHRACRPVTMGSLYWQLNDVWPSISWSSIDSAGRPKALQYHAKRFYAPLAVAAAHAGGKTSLSLISDATTPTGATWRLTVMGMDGSNPQRQEHDVTLPPLSSTPVATLTDAQLFGQSDPKTHIALAELVMDGKTVSRALIEPVLPRDATLPDPALRATWGKDGHLTLHATRLARAVWVDFGMLDATLSDNAFDLMPGESREIAVTSSASLALLKRNLHIRTLAGEIRP
ncbi:beta-mannosidase [Novosphingobium terrae]|uniref:beta-mannosidase n=1 Tax=Novosphingobium terrae TaxID=2726189 RepID=UPI00198194F5